MQEACEGSCLPLRCGWGRKVWSTRPLPTARSRLPQLHHRRPRSRTATTSGSCSPCSGRSTTPAARAPDRSTGMPDTCDDSCASVLLPFAASCATFLQLPMNVGMKTIIDAVVGTCRGPLPWACLLRRLPVRAFLTRAERRLVPRFRRG